MSHTGLTLTARGVHVALGGTPILVDVDVDVVPGEVLVLVGPNGAGKSTLLGVLAGDVEPDAGTVEIGGRRLHAQPARELARQRGVLLQKQGLAFGFRTEEVVRMGRAPWYRSERSHLDDAFVAGSMHRTDVTHLAQRLFPTLSGGEQARTSFARLLAQDTPILMLDEPTAALDIRHQEQVLRVAREAAADGAAVVVVLHDLSLAAAYADRVCVLSAGRMRAQGAPTEVFTSALISEVYDHPVEVLSHAGELVIIPVRDNDRSEATCPPHA